jgi:LemA protein
MSAEQISLWAVAAVLLFWAVGAYNRLVRLRAAIKQSFASVEAHFRQRDALLAQWLEACGATAGEPSLGKALHAVEGVRAACTQVVAAVDHARPAPSGAQAIASLRLAEEVLIGARGRLSTELASGARLHARLQATSQVAWDTVLQTDALAAVDGSLGFARGQFNEAVQAYNDAATQFPTWVIAGVFGFRAAGVL